MEEEDYIVRELDVVVCSGTLGSGTQTVLLQYPLRGAARPYQLGGIESVRYKPKNKKLQAMQLRPAMTHLDVERDGAKKAALKEEEGGSPSDVLIPVMVQVKKRETEAQQEARLRSFAHLAALDAAEEWVDLQYHGEMSEASQGIASKLAAQSADPAMYPMPRADYLAALVPDPATEGAGEVQELLIGVAATASRGSPASAPSPAAAAAPLPPPQVAAMSRAQAVLFRHNPVCSLNTLRAFLQKNTSEAGLAAAVAAATDASLHASAIATGRLLCIRRAYLLRTLDAPALDPLRDVVLRLLEGKEALKRGDIMDAARAAAIPVTDSLYSRVVRDICSSRGSSWSLKVT